MWTDTQHAIWCECHAKTKQGPGEWWKLPSASLTWECLGSVLHSVAVRKGCPEASLLKQAYGKRKWCTSDMDDILSMCKLKSNRWGTLVLTSHNLTPELTPLSVGLNFNVK